MASFQKNLKSRNGFKLGITMTVQLFCAPISVSYLHASETSPGLLQMLMQIADDFIDNVVTASCQLAKHRKSNTIEVKDVQLHLG